MKNGEQSKGKLGTGSKKAAKRQQERNEMPVVPVLGEGLNPHKKTVFIELCHLPTPPLSLLHRGKLDGLVRKVESKGLRKAIT